MEQLRYENDIHAEYERIHQRAKELLGKLYDEKRFDGVMASFIHDDAGLKESMDRLEIKLSRSESEEEKDTIRENWLDEEDILTQALSGEEIE